MIPESEAWDGRMLPEHEPWNSGIVPESEPRRAGRVSGLFCFLFSFSSVLSPGRWRSSQSRTC